MRPDVWVFIDVENKETGEKFVKIVAGFYGGFTQGNSWRITSPVAKLETLAESFRATTESGRVYTLDACNNRIGTPIAPILASIVADTELPWVVSIRKEEV